MLGRQRLLENPPKNPKISGLFCGLCYNKKKAEDVCISVGEGEWSSMKRLLCLVSALCLTALVLSGCGDKKGESSSSTPSLAPTVTPVSSAPEQTAKALRIKADSGLNVRASASTDGEVLGVAEEGEMLALLVEDPKDGWYQVQYEGKSAYVSAEFAEVKEVTLEEYNRLKNGGEPSSSSSASSESSSEASKTEGSGSSSKPESSEVSSEGNTEDGE